MSYMKKSQKEIVFEVIKEVRGNNYSPNESMRHFFGNSYSPIGLNSDWATSNSFMILSLDLLEKKYLRGDLVINKKFENKLHLRKYLKKLVFNWLNKDKKLNGNRNYKLIKNTFVQFQNKKFLKE